MFNQITIKDVAKLADVSISTVSRVLNGNPKVNEELRRRVLSAAEQLQYSPNEIARSLKTSTLKQIAFLVSNTDDQYFTSISRGIEKAISPYGYTLIVCSTYFDVEKERSFIQSFMDRRISGLVINTVGHNDEAIAKISRLIPTVLCGRMINSAEFTGDFVDFDNIGGMYSLTKHLLSFGHRKVGIISGPRYLSTARERFLGFQSAMNDSGININSDYPYLMPDCVHFSEECGYETTERLMSLSDRPTAIIATNGVTAVGAMHYFLKNGIRVPEDISFCNFDNIAHSELFRFNPTHVSTDRAVMGHSIGSLILERINNMNRMPNREIRLPSQLIGGNSIAAV